MKYRALVTALSLALGGGLASAGNDPSSTTDATPPPTTNQAAPQTTDSTTPQPTERTTPQPTEQSSQRTQPVDLFFETDSAELSGNADAELKHLADWSRCNRNGAIILEGHADPRGTVAYNMKLSAERAAAVREKLIAMGVPSSKIVISVYGETGPRRPTLAQDRRVTVKVANRPVSAALATPT